MGDYWVDANLRPCRLATSDLGQLLHVIEGGLPGQEIPPDIAIRSYLPHLCAHGRTLAEYLAIEGLPDRVSRLEIRCVRRGRAPELDRSVELTFLPILTRLWIEGPDECWVLKTRDEVCAILAAKRPWYWPLVGRWVWLGLLLLASLAGLPAALHRVRPLLYLGGAVGLLGLEVAAVLDAKDQLLPHTEIVLRERGVHLEWRHLAAALSVASLALLILNGVMVLLAR